MENLFITSEMNCEDYLHLCLYFGVGDVMQHSFNMVLESLCEV